jgi:Fic family protein
MYEPNIKVTARLMDNLAGIEDMRQLLDSIPILPSVEGTIQRRSLVETIHYSTRIEGNQLDIHNVEKLSSSQVPKPPIDRDEQEVLNLYKAMDFINYIADQHELPISENVIKQIHAFVMRDIPGPGSPGVYKLEQNAIADETTGERIFLPPKPGDVPQLMGDFCHWLSRKPMAFHPVITAGIAHLELVAIHPFDNGNGRTARALADLIMNRNGYGFRQLFSWVAQIGIDMTTYHKTLRKVLGPEYGANVDPTAWLEYFTEAVNKSLATRRSELLQIRKIFVDVYNAGQKKGLTKDQVEAVVYAGVYGSVTSGVYMQSTELSRSTVVKRLNQLVEFKLLEPEGKGRNARYVLPSQVSAGLRQPKPQGVQLGLETIEKSTTNSASS